MADAIVFIVTEQLVSTIRLELEQKVRLVVGVRKEVESLSTTFRSIQAVLQDAEEQQITSAAVKHWLEELKDIAYDADDVLDEWKTRILMSKSQADQGATRTDKVLSYLSSPCPCFYPIVVRYDISYRIKLIREWLDEVVCNKDQFKLKEIHSPQGRPSPRPLTSSVADVSKIYGRDLDKEIILSRLLADTSSEEETHVPTVFTIVSIVGTGGFGKTTLAQLVFNEADVVNTFELKIWVCVSELFERERVAKEIIQQAGGNAHNVVGWEDLHQGLCASVKGKRFLLVLDDVWSDNRDDWTPIQLSLNGGKQGSRIIITTRNEKVAKMVGSTYMHRLAELSDDYCWSLFQQIAFLGRSHEDRERLEEIGIGITRKCKGVPLAVKAIAGVMCFKQTKQDWRNVLASDTWKVELEKGFLPAILLSYHALPSHLKQCFMYCAALPKGKIIEKDELVKLWMAQGYLNSDGRKELEMVGAEYFDDLAMRSFFQDFVKNDVGNFVSCQMHDLVHDFAQFLTKTECVVSQTSGIEISSSKVRHMTYFDVGNTSIHKLRNLRTLILRSCERKLLPLHQLTCLRALDLSTCDLRELPNELEGLLHLRFLNLSASRILEVPQTICNLYNLQTLKLNQCGEVRRLPEEIGSLVNLRHLEMEATGNLNYFPASIGRLHQLRTLSKFIVSCNNGGCTIGELGSMNYLSGHLEIIVLRQVENAKGAKHAELQKKTNINFLKVQFNTYQEIEEVREDEIKRMESILEGLEPHNNLETLVIYGYPGAIFPHWMSSEASLSNIVELKLVDCNGCTLLPPGLGKLRYLERLFIRMDSVKHLGPEFCGVGVASNEETIFPKLKCLTFIMKELEDWVIPSSKFKRFMPCLRELGLLGCSKLTALSLESVGVEFMGISDDDEDSGSRRIGGGGAGESVRQQLLVFQKDYVCILPHLCDFEVANCPKLKTFPALVKMQSLERLCLSGLHAVKHVSSELFGIFGVGGGRTGESTSASSSSSMIIFQNLKELVLESFGEWEEKIEDITTSTTTTVSMFPSLNDLRIESCEKLKVVPHYLFPHSLRSLFIARCPQLAGMQPCLPLLLESLTLEGNVGVLSSSLLPIIAQTSSSNNSYPNLKSFVIWRSPHSSLPQGLYQLTSLKKLEFLACDFLDFEPAEELRHFPMLNELQITNCPILRERCSRENWSISLSLSANVYIDYKRITGRNC